MIRRLLVLSILCASCTDPYFAPQNARLTLQADAPFCGNLFVEAKVDNVRIFLDTLKGATPSAVISLPPGAHVLGARRLAIRNGTDTLTTYTWPDTTVTLNPLQSLNRMLPLYCS